MRLTKSVTSKLLVAALGLLLVGCTTPTGPGDGQTPIDQTIRLQWWGVFWDADVVQPLIDEYQDLNPNVEIVYQNKWPGGNRALAAEVYKTSLERVLNTNDPDQIPDIFMVENTWAGNYDNRYTSPAPASVIDVATVQAAFYPAVLTDFVTNGTNVNGLPIWMDTYAILYNRRLLQEVAVTQPPSDWIGFRNLATSLTKRTAGTITQGGFAAGTNANMSFAAELIYILMFQNNVAMTNTQGQPIFANNPDAEVAVKFNADFANTAVVGSWSSAMPNDSLAFLNGDLAMLLSTSWRYQDILFFNDKYNLGLDIGVAAIPQLTSSSPKNYASYWGMMAARNRPNSTEAWKFMEWLTRKEQLRKLRTNDARVRNFFGFLYPRKDMQDELLFDSYISVFNNSLAHAQSWYMVDGLAVDKAIRNMIQAGGKASDISAAQSEIRNIIDNKGRLLR